MKAYKRNERNKESKNNFIKTLNQSINNVTKYKKQIDFETIKKIILYFYPREDEYFFDLIFSQINETKFFRELVKFYKNINIFSDEDPENKFYGVQNFTKIPKNRKSIESFELNKLNTDLIFVLVKEILLSSYEENIDKKSLIKSKLNEIYNFTNLKSLSFISNKVENYTSLFPVNFYAFCVTIKILILCYPEQIKSFHIGVFMNSELTFFNQNNNDCFLSELFCCYLTYLFFSSHILKNEIATMCLHFLDDSNIYEAFTFHISDNGYDAIKKILPKKEKYDILTLLKEFFNDILYRISIYLHYIISNDAYKEIIEFINFGEFPKRIHIYCDKAILNKKYVNLFKDLTNCKELNIHLISNNCLLDSNKENKINLKDDENDNITNFSLDGEFIYIDNMPVKMSKIRSLKLINKKRSYFMQDETEYKKMHNNICFNFQKEFFNNFDYLEELTLKHITPEQFFSLVNCLISTNDKNASSIFKIYLEINYSHIKISSNNFSHIKILSNTDNGISKIDILRNVDSLIRNCKRIYDIRQLEINLKNDNPQNNLLLTKENGFYFISLVLELLKRCYQFSFKNFNNYYYPLNDVQPDIKRKDSFPTRTRSFKRRSQEFEKKNDEEFCLQDDVHNCKVQTNNNKDLQVVYNGYEYDDISYIMDLNSALPFLFIVKNRLPKLQPKALLFNIVKYFSITMKAPKQISVCNFNN
jgi:hypothetical protein